MDDRIKAARDRGLEQLAAETHGDLSLASRQALWLALSDALGDRARAARYYLARQCVLRVRPLWRHVFGGQDTYERCMVETAALWRGTGDADDGRRWQGALWTFLDNYGSAPAPDLQAIWAGYSACALLPVVLGDELLMGPDYQGLTDRELDPEETDCAYTASCAEAKGPPGALTAPHAEARRAFWSWYLGVAVGVAIDVASADEPPVELEDEVGRGMLSPAPEDVERALDQLSADNQFIIMSKGAEVVQAAWQQGAYAVEWFTTPAQEPDIHRLHADRRMAQRAFGRLLPALAAT